MIINAYECQRCGKGYTIGSREEGNLLVTDPYCSERCRTGPKAHRRRERNHAEAEPPYLGPDVQHKLVAVLSTPCSGTSYMAQYLYQAGFDVAHERMAADGIVCGFFVWSKRGGYEFDRYSFDRIYRLIRHPLDVLETLPNFINNWGAVLGPGSPVHQALRLWVATHERIPQRAPVVRLGVLEDEIRMVQDLAKLKGIATQIGPFSGMRITSKARRWPRQSWESLHGLDPNLTQRALDLVYRYEVESRGAP